jgi:hypothetical protein
MPQLFRPAWARCRRTSMTSRHTGTHTAIGSGTQWGDNRGQHRLPRLGIGCDGGGFGFDRLAQQRALHTAFGPHLGLKMKGTMRGAAHIGSARGFSTQTGTAPGAALAGPKLGCALEEWASHRIAHAAPKMCGHSPPARPSGMLQRPGSTCSVACLAQPLRESPTHVLGPPASLACRKLTLR